MADGGWPLHISADRPIYSGAPGKLKIVGFAGGGGSSVAVKLALGSDPDLCANHWLTAVLAHKRHFPQTEHHWADMFEVDARAWRAGEQIAFGWFSPDCTDFSKAKGGAPRSERIRGLAWSVIPWAMFRQVRTIMVENVEEFVQWGPVHRSGPKAGEPIAERRGETFKRWVGRLERIGYVVEWRVLNAADYGAPTTRKRLYVIAKYVGWPGQLALAEGGASPIVWPELTHAPRHKAAKLGLKPWRGAHECIDWSEDCPSIFLTQPEIKAAGLRVKRPLVPATHKRIARGLEKFVIGSAEPFIVPVTHQGDSRVHSARDPLRTATAAHRGELALIDAAMISNAYGSNTRGGRGDPLDPTKTLTGAHHSAIIQTKLSSALVRTDMQSAAARNGVRDVAEPTCTTTSAGGLAMVSAALTMSAAHGEHGERPGSRSRAADEPVSTFHASGGNIALVSGCLIPRYGERAGQAPRALSITGPYPTGVPTLNGGSLVAVSLQRQFGRSKGSAAGDPMGAIMAGGGGKTAVLSAFLGRQFGSTVSGLDMRRPAPTIMTEGGGGKLSVVTAFMAQGNRATDGRAATSPVSTLTTRSTQQQLVVGSLGSYYAVGTGSDLADPMRAATQKDRHGLTLAHMLQANTGLVGHAMTDALSAIVGLGSTQQLIETALALEGGPVGRRAQVLGFLWEHFGVPTPAEWADPAGTLQARLKFGLVLLDGVAWMIVDIGLRMLKPSELAAAMGLPAGYDLTVDAEGRAISKTHQIQMIGNMVSPPPAEALIRANCPQLIEPPEERLAA